MFCSFLVPTNLVKIDPAVFHFHSSKGSKNLLDKLLIDVYRCLFKNIQSLYHFINPLTQNCGVLSAYRAEAQLLHK